MLDETRSWVLNPRLGDHMADKTIERAVVDVRYREGRLYSVRVWARRKSGRLPRQVVGATMSAYQWKRWAATAEVVGE